jgi:hypothetical protein
VEARLASWSCEGARADAGAAEFGLESAAAWAWAMLAVQKKSMPAAGRVIHLRVNLRPRFRVRGR